MQVPVALARPVGRRFDPSAERGSALPLLVLAVVVAGGGILGLARIGAAAADRARAGVAADASALAGAADGEKAARAMAGANGGRLLRYEQRGLDSRVTVRVGTATAVGRARSATKAGMCRPAPDGHPDRFGLCPPGGGTGVDGRR